MSNNEYINANEIFDFLNKLIKLNFLITAINCIQIKQDGIYSPIEWIAYIGNSGDHDWHYHFNRQDPFFNFIKQALEHEPNFCFEVFYETQEEFELGRSTNKSVKNKIAIVFNKFWSKCAGVIPPQIKNS